MAEWEKGWCKGCFQPIDRSPTGGRKREYCDEICRKGNDGLSRAARWAPLMIARATPERAKQLKALAMGIGNSQAWNKGVESAKKRPRDSRGRFVKASPWQA